MGPGARFVYGLDTVRQRRAVPLLSDEWPRLREGDDVTALTGRVRPASVRPRPRGRQMEFSLCRGRMGSEPAVRGTQRACAASGGVAGRAAGGLQRRGARTGAMRPCSRAVWACNTAVSPPGSTLSACARKAGRASCSANEAFGTCPFPWCHRLVPSGYSYLTKIMHTAYTDASRAVASLL